MSHDRRHRQILPTPRRASSRRPALVGPLGLDASQPVRSWLSTAVTLVLGYVILRIADRFVEWAFVHAIWTVPYHAHGVARNRGVPERQGHRCVLGGHRRQVPADPVRPLSVSTSNGGRRSASRCSSALYVVSAIRRFWRKELALIWVGALTVVGVLMWGGVFGLPPVTEDYWGGLPITLILATFGLAFAFPLAILVALGRRSTKLPAVKMLCVVYVELIRGVPLISVLFMASVMFPLFMPAGVNIDKLLRAQIAIILFAAAYLAEVVRGGLQALPKGQAEAADALGLSYWKKTGFIILPQALRLVIPPLVNTFIGFFKDTSLVLIIGLFDLLTMGKVALERSALAELLHRGLHHARPRSTSRSASPCRDTAAGWSGNLPRPHAADGDPAMSQAATADFLPQLADTNAPPAIVLDKVNKWYGALHVLRDISLTIAEKERVVVCGPSGSGKSTMIRCINRLETHQEGRIFVDGTELTDDTRALDTIRREVGMVFQSFNLFPHLTILENCTLAPIWVRKMPKAEAEELAMSYLARVKIPEQAKKYPGPAVRRAAAARRHRPRALHAAEDHAVRRTDLRARSRK